MIPYGIKLSLPARIGLTAAGALLVSLTVGRACMTAYADSQLRQSIEEGRVDCVAYWLQREANINAADDFGDTPLMIAARHAQPRVVQLLLAQGADPAARDRFGMNAAHWAQFRSRESRIFRRQNGLEIRQVPRPEALQTIALFAR